MRKGIRLSLVMLFSVLSLAVFAFAGIGITTDKAMAATTPETFEFENGAYVKITGEGGMRFRLKMDAETAASINAGEKTLTFYAIPAQYADDVVDDDYDALVDVNHATKNVVTAGSVYAGSTDEGLPDGYYYANCLFNINLAQYDNAYNDLELYAAAVYDETAVVSPVRTMHDAATMCAIYGYMDSVMNVYEWLGTASYKLNITNADDYTALLNALDQAIGNYTSKYIFLDDVVDTAGLLETYANAGITSYDVTWVDGDGDTLKTDNVAYGTVPEYDGTTPTKTGDEYVYSFDAWDNEIVAVTGNVTYTATFTQAINPVITDAIATINGIRTFIDDTTACGDEIDDARSAYDGLTAAQKTLVDNYDYLTDAEAIYAKKSTLSSIATMNSGFTGATPANRISLTSNISTYDTALSGLTSAQKERVSGYDKYTGIKSSYTVVYDMVGSDLKDKILVDGGGLNGFYNGETHPNPSVFKPMCLFDPYGYCARVQTTDGYSGRFNLKPTDAFKATLDLSAYTHVLIGAQSATKTCTYNWSNGTSPHELVTSTNTSDFVTLRLTVEEFLTGYIYVMSTSNSIWFTAIVAVYDPAGVISDINDYLTALGDNEITLANHKTYVDAATSINARLAANEACNVFVTNLDAYNAKKFTMVYNMRGTDLREKITIGDNTVGWDIANGKGVLNNFHNRDTFAALSTVGDDKDPYGICSRIVKYSGVIKIKPTDTFKATLDLSDYNYVLIGVLNVTDTCSYIWGDGLTNRNLGANTNTTDFVTLKLTVEEFLSGYIAFENSASTIWLTSIIAVVE